MPHERQLRLASAAAAAGAGQKPVRAGRWQDCAGSIRWADSRSALHGWGQGEGQCWGESLPADEPGVAPASVVVSLKQSPFVSVTCPCHEEEVSNSRKNMLTPEYRLAARYLVNLLLLLVMFSCLSAPITTIKSPMSSSSRKRKKVVS